MGFTWGFVCGLAAAFGVSTLGLLILITVAVGKMKGD